MFNNFFFVLDISRSQPLHTKQVVIFYIVYAVETEKKFQESVMLCI